MSEVNTAAYAPGTPGHDRLSEKYGEAGANRIYAAAQTGSRDAVIEAVNRENGTYNGTSRWSDLWDQIYNEPFRAPLEQFGRIASDAVDAAGDAAKKVTASAAKNWGAWLIGGVIVIGAFLYFGGAKVFKSKSA